MPIIQAFLYVGLAALAIFLFFWTAVTILSVGAVYGGGVSVRNYFISLTSNVEFEKPT